MSSTGSAAGILGSRLACRAGILGSRLANRAGIIGSRLACLESVASTTHADHGATTNTEGAAVVTKGMKACHKAVRTTTRGWQSERGGTSASVRTC